MGTKDIKDIPAGRMDPLGRPKPTFAHTYVCTFSPDGVGVQMRHGDQIVVVFRFGIWGVFFFGCRRTPDPLLSPDRHVPILCSSYGGFSREVLFSSTCNVPLLRSGTESYETEFALVWAASSKAVL